VKNVDEIDTWSSLESPKSNVDEKNAKSTKGQDRDFLMHVLSFELFPLKFCFKAFLPLNTFSQG